MASLKPEPQLSSPSGTKHDRNHLELAAAVVLPGRGTLVIMEACGLSSRQRAGAKACAVLPVPGIVG